MRVPIGIVKEGERNPKHWILLAGSTTSEFVNHLAIDNFENCYMSSYENSPSSFIRKYDNQSNLLFKKQFVRSGSTDQEWYGDIDVSGSGNIYGYLLKTTTPNYLSKRNSLAEEQWRILSSIGYSLSGPSLDSSENVYVGATQPFAFGGVATQSPNGSAIIKLNASGQIAWQRKLKNNSIIDGSGSESAEGLFAGKPHPDSSGNVFFISTIVRNFQGSGKGIGTLVAKYNSSGTLQWQRAITSFFDRNFGTSNVVSDISGNLYLCSSDSGPVNGESRAVIIKLDSNGNLLWQRNIFNLGAVGIQIDQDSNLYVALSGGLHFVKYNSSGNLQWQRRVSISSSSSSSLSVQDFRLSSQGILYILANVFPKVNDKSVLLLSLPKDGSVRGAYTVEGSRITISEGTLSEAAASVTVSTYSAPSVSPPQILSGDPGGRTIASVGSTQTVVKI